MTHLDAGTTFVRVRGRERRLRTVRVDGREVVVTGRLVRVAALRDEWYADLEGVDRLAAALRLARAGADVFTFPCRPPDGPDPAAHLRETENCAAIELRGYDHWWTRQIGSKTRALVRKAERAGVTLRVVPLDEVLLRGIQEIYDESPVRQGKPFWHYRRSLAELQRIHETFPDRSEFVGAYLGDELVGFVKLVYAGATANTMHIIARLSRRELPVSNALIAKSVAVASARGARLLVYDRFDYGGGSGDSLLQFKRHNGFERLEYARCWVPL
ncbi:MAG: hypothetical protein ACK52I_19135, partial [Pseudomonadota bacterium]